MPRPKLPRRCRCDPSVTYFKPRGIPLSSLEEVSLDRDEVEALKLHDVDGLDHLTAAKKMGISQPTFGRIINSTYKKIAKAIITGQAIRLG